MRKLIQYKYNFSAFSYRINHFKGSFVPSGLIKGKSLCKITVKSNSPLQKTKKILNIYPFKLTNLNYIAFKGSFTLLGVSATKILSFQGFSIGPLRHVTKCFILIYVCTFRYQICQVHGLNFYDKNLTKPLNHDAITFDANTREKYTRYYPRVASCTVLRMVVEECYCVYIEMYLCY